MQSSELLSLLDLDFLFCFNESKNAFLLLLLFWGYFLGVLFFPRRPTFFFFLLFLLSTSAISQGFSPSPHFWSGLIPVCV